MGPTATLEDIVRHVLTYFQAMHRANGGRELPTVNPLSPYKITDACDAHVAWLTVHHIDKGYIGVCV